MLAKQNYDTKKESNMNFKQGQGHSPISKLLRSRRFSNSRWAFWIWISTISWRVARHPERSDFCEGCIQWLLYVTLLYFVLLCMVLVMMPLLSFFFAVWKPGTSARLRSGNEFWLRGSTKLLCSNCNTNLAVLRSQIKGTDGWPKRRPWMQSICRSGSWFYSSLNPLIWTLQVWESCL